MASFLPSPRNTGPMKPGPRRRPTPRPRPSAPPNSRVVPAMRRAARVAHNRVPEARMPRRRFGDVPRARPGAAAPRRGPARPLPRLPGDVLGRGRPRGPVIRLDPRERTGFPDNVLGRGDAGPSDIHASVRNEAEAIARRRAGMVRPAALPNRGLVRLSQRRVG